MHVRHREVAENHVVLPAGQDPIDGLLAAGCGLDRVGVRQKLNEYVQQHRLVVDDEDAPGFPRDAKRIPPAIALGVVDGQVGLFHRTLHGAQRFRSDHFLAARIPDLPAETRPSTEFSRAL